MRGADGICDAAFRFDSASLVADDKGGPDAVVLLALVLASEALCGDDVVNLRIVSFGVSPVFFVFAFFDPSPDVDGARFLVSGGMPACARIRSTRGACFSALGAMMHNTEEARLLAQELVIQPDVLRSSMSFTQPYHGAADFNSNQARCDTSIPNTPHLPSTAPEHSERPNTQARWQCKSDFLLFARLCTT